MCITYCFAMDVKYCWHEAWNSAVVVYFTERVFEMNGCVFGELSTTINILFLFWFSSITFWRVSNLDGIWGWSLSWPWIYPLMPVTTSQFSLFKVHHSTSYLSKIVPLIRRSPPPLYRPHFSRMQKKETFVLWPVFLRPCLSAILLWFTEEHGRL
jgi:hypothetical protein